MAFNQFEYTKSWESATDFPAVESNEATARADIQLLYDEIAAGLNTVLQNIQTTLTNTANKLPTSSAVYAGIADEATARTNAITAAVATLNQTISALPNPDWNAVSGKGQILNRPTIYISTSAPSDAVGNNGDIYIKYEA